MNRLIAKLKGNSRGDTIIEVVISIAIIGIALGTGYALSNQSLDNGVEAGERTKALYLAKGQVEVIKDAYISSLSGNSTNLNEYKTRTSGKWCISTYTSNFGRTVSADAGATTTCTSGFYNTSYLYNNSSGLFTVTTTWVTRGGEGINTLKQYYKVAI